MAKADTNPRQRQFHSIFRHHVLAPVRAAESRVERERTEIVAERDAFEQFAKRVADVPPVSPRAQVRPIGTRTVVNPSNEANVRRQTAEALRRAYADTVVAVPHYDDVYGEPVVENAAAEFGPELARLLVPSDGAAFVRRHKEALVGAAERGVTEREEFRGILDTEIDSLRASRRELTAVLDELETTTVPSGYRTQFEDDLTRTLRARQSTLASQPTLSHLDAHNVCTYLYDDEPWTYPVLTAVARVLDSVTVRD
jgi:hypothetical protein